MKFQDIKPFHSYGDYQINVMLPYVKTKIDEWQEELGLNLIPDYQRGHVWTEAQQIKYVEFLLRQGKSGRDILFNHTKWNNLQKLNDGDFECVDGLQRITAILRFLNNEIKAFGHYFNEYEDQRMMNSITVVFHVNNLPERKDVLEWYLQLNSGGTVHSEEELERVNQLLMNELSGG